MSRSSITAADPHLLPAPSGATLPGDYPGAPVLAKKSLTFGRLYHQKRQPFLAAAMVVLPAPVGIGEANHAETQRSRAADLDRIAADNGFDFHIIDNEIYWDVRVGLSPLYSAPD